MKITRTELDGVYVIEPVVYGDNRGWFMESFRADKLRELGINTDFVQDNQSFSAQKGTLRGLHFQNFPYAQSKLVRCLRGEILDVAVDMRAWSKSYKKWIAVKLSAENKKQLYIPRGFAHGFLTLTDDVEIAYKVDEYYNKECDSGIRYDDADVGVEWNVIDPILSEKDKNGKTLCECNSNLSARVLVTGVKGQLGYDVIKLLRAKGIECKGADIEDFDLTDEVAVRRFVEDYRPTIIVHCAAYTAVDRAEDEQEKCHAINVLGTGYLADSAERLGAKFMYISTDYVYGGGGSEPLSENARINPLNVYGRTKYQGEQVALATCKKSFVLRTSWVFGKNGNNFVKTMLKLARERAELTIVNDQVGSPTYTPDLARLIVDMIFTEKYGVYNASNEGCCSWFEFAREIFALSGAKVKAVPVGSEAYVTKAKRPLNSRMDKTRLVENGFKPLPDWKDALKRYLEEI